MAVNPLTVTLYPNAFGMGYVISESPKDIINYGIANWSSWEWLQQFITAFALSSLMIFVFRLIDLKMLIEMVKNK